MVSKEEMITEIENRVDIVEDVAQEKKDYLYLPSLAISEEYLITMVPINSSGDIYHILAYLLLAMEHNKQIPKVELTYDTGSSANLARPAHSNLTTCDQVMRSKAFADTLGLDQYVTILDLSNVEESSSSYRSTGRQFKLKKTLTARASQNSPIYYLDQIATTTLISTHVMEFGYLKTTEILRRRFSSRDQKHFSKDMQNKVDTFFKEILEEIKNKRSSPTQKLLILHIRYSSNANGPQKLEGSFILAFKRYLQYKGYQVCFILADDRVIGPEYVESTETNEFDAQTVLCKPFNVKELYDAKTGKDFAKQNHLQLLLSLSGYENTHAIIGNTSGTLDLAALIGLSTYSIHKFCETKISYQECRLYFQLAFMSIGKLIKVKVERNKDSDQIDGNFGSWLDLPHPGVNRDFFPYKDYKGIEEHIKSRDSGARKQYNNMFFIHKFSKGAKIEEVPLPRIAEVCTYVSMPDAKLISENKSKELMQAEASSSSSGFFSNSATVDANNKGKEAMLYSSNTGSQYLIEP